MAQIYSEESLTRIEKVKKMRALWIQPYAQSFKRTN